MFESDALPRGQGRLVTAGSCSHSWAERTKGGGVVAGVTQQKMEPACGWESHKGDVATPAMLSKAENEGQYIPASLSPILPSPTGVKLSEGRGQPSGMQNRAG